MAIHIRRREFIVTLGSVANATRRAHAAFATAVIRYLNALVLRTDELMCFGP